MEVFFETNIETTYTYNQRDDIRQKLRDNGDIKDLAKLVGYYKTESLSVNDILYIINSIKITNTNFIVKEAMLQHIS